MILPEMAEISCTAFLNETQSTQFEWGRVLCMLPTINSLWTGVLKARIKQEIAGKEIVVSSEE